MYPEAATRRNYLNLKIINLYFSLFFCLCVCVFMLYVFGYDKKDAVSRVKKATAKNYEMSFFIFETRE